MVAPGLYLAPELPVDGPEYMTVCIFGFVLLVDMCKFAVVSMPTML